MTDAQLKSLESNLGMKIDNFADYHDGFSFTVATELEAYKAAYKYQGCKRVTVKFAPNVNQWSVSVYLNTMPRMTNDKIAVFNVYQQPMEK